MEVREMETGYVVVVVTAPASAEEMTFQTLVANTPAAGKRLRDSLRDFRGKYNMVQVATRPFRLRGTQGLQEGKA
jgi:hypothetical protein